MTPCRAVEKYIKTADAEFFKVLAFVLCSDSGTADTVEIAERCNIRESVAEDAVLFWLDRGVLKTVGKVKPQSAAPQPQPASETREKPAAPPKTAVRYTPKEIARKSEENEDIAALFEESQKIFGRLLNDTEMQGLINIYEYCGFEVAAILMIEGYCKDLGKCKIGYIEKVAKEWFSEGIVDFSQVENEIIRRTSQHSFDKQVALKLGIEGRLTPVQEKYFTQWREWGFDVAAINLAGERCRETKNKTDIRYINGILSRWKDERLLTTEDVLASEEAFRRKQAQKTENEKSGKDTSYDLDKWQSMAASLDLNMLGFEEDEDV